MNTFEVLGPPGGPHAIPAMYPRSGPAGGVMYPLGAPGQQSHSFGAVRWTRSRGVPSRIRRLIQRGYTSSAQRRARRRPARRQYSTRRPDPNAAARRRSEAAARRARGQRRRSQAAARRAASRGWRQAYYQQTGRMPPPGMRREIERVNIEVARLKAATAARRKAEAQRKAQIRAGLHPIFTTKQPAANAGIREWEAYYKATGTAFLPGQRSKVEYREKTAFSKATGHKFYVPRSFSRVSRVGVRRGVRWMFAVAYRGNTMPYWDLWYYRKKTADQIARMVAEDYRREVGRRVQLTEKNIRERESWQDAGRPGPAPRIDYREGLTTPITPARIYA